ncbi:hypothetical protein CEP52_009293 [Fusarium oligoseptatum]|uniref:Aromatic amino acid beta-eliminating lyase/threonine aldolase domain-containing protein n=1 Tax=Fusarium oligoseptatum TaxID=2604345 RepID=A0A428TDL0_9HYPO|nr:hypothetical protein CEP52_009293 [Fusarium oligoseptatum]
MIQTSFMDDYSEGAHPKVLAKLLETNLSQQKAYGDDEYCNMAKDCLREKLGDSTLAVHFVAGGTLANIIAIGSCLRPHEAVIAASTGHITVRETGAIEAIGHKIISIPSTDGKLTPESISNALANNAHYPHMAKPRLVYISNATEMGTLYTKAELSAISDLCKQRNLLLYLDGARLGAALSATKNDLTLPDLVRLTDIFWIGGTKVGMLLGEAIVICNPLLSEDFPFHFLEMFSTNLWFDLARHTNEMAQLLSSKIQEAGYKLAAETETNQVFAVLPNSLVTTLQDQFQFYVWEKVDGEHTMVRLVTSWATSKEQVEAFANKL